MWRVALAHARYGVVGTLQLNTLMGACHGMCVVWLPLDWQWVTFCLFACLRMATFATFSIYAAEAFGPSASATLTGFIFLVGGLASENERWGKDIAKLQFYQAAVVPYCS